MAISDMSSLGKIPELRKRILFTILMLAVYRFGVHVSTPGIDIVALKQLLDSAKGSFVGLINLFSGGALENFSILTLGVAPYISVSIIVQILAPTIPSLAALKKEGEAGQRILTRYIRQFTIILALFQSYMIATGLESQGYVIAGGLTFRLCTMFTLTAGTAFMMWLGEQITEKGLGNGVSILIFAGIVARMPEVLVSTLVLARQGEIAPFSVLLMFLFAVASVAAIVYVERSHRRIPIQYPRRMVGKAMTQAQLQYMPLKVNMSGVIPPIFASAIIAVPTTIASLSNFDWLKRATAVLTDNVAVYDAVFVTLVFLFGFFYTSLIFNPEEVAENLKKNGGSVPTVRPGKPTADFFYYVLNRLTVWGGIYIALVCVLPKALYLWLGAGQFSYVFGGTAVLIAVGVTLDTASQIESYVVARNYESFMQSSSKNDAGIAAIGYNRGRVLRR
jgi:preprotein translocase subunit SecY